MTPLVTAAILRIHRNRDASRISFLEYWRDKGALDESEIRELAALPRRIKWLERQLMCAQENATEQVQVSA
jgi:hypothetical protein